MATKREVRYGIKLSISVVEKAQLVALCGIDQVLSFKPSLLV
jgi:hypothetical protein